MAAKQYTYITAKAARDPDFREAFSGGLSYDLFKWALAATITRQNEVPAPSGSPVLALIPVWDFCNHAPAGETETSFVATAQPAGGPTGESSSSRALECRALVPITGGSEVHIFYGCRPSSELLVYSGFVSTANLYDQVALRLSLHQDAQGTSEDSGGATKARLLLARSLGFSPEKSAAGTWEVPLALSAAAVSAVSDSASGTSSSAARKSAVDLKCLRLAALVAAAEDSSATAWLRAFLGAKAAAPADASAADLALSTCPRGSSDRPQKLLEDALGGLLAGINERRGALSQYLGSITSAGDSLPASVSRRLAITSALLENEAALVESAKSQNYMKGP